MNSYLIWVLSDNAAYIKVELLEEMVESEVYEIQKQFVGKGYMISTISKTADGRLVFDMYKAKGGHEYAVGLAEAFYHTDEALMRE